MTSASSSIESGPGPDVPGTHPARWGRVLDDGRVQCLLCPRECRMRAGQRGFCFVRGNNGGRLVLDTWGRSSGFCLDPIEKKPLNHFLPGTSVLSFGTAGCNLGCRFCQNHEISTSRHVDTLTDVAEPEDIADAAVASGAEIRAMADWIVANLGPDVPHHFSAFHPDNRMRDVPPTPPSTLRRARDIALDAGERFVYTGNVHDKDGDTTFCPGCDAPVIVRDWYRMVDYQLVADEAGRGACPQCGTVIPGLYDAAGPGDFGPRRIPVRIAGG